ncbi:hypothetical protein [Paractinoplanes lichenicola]|uniref:Uncharacterized protein n=1 Tax=Paractinoplanes lichenicola TaxID=2802976 RepID=A0ABS1VYE3_9ACTN|nr:hypothetical protein [Actinoplanes lichenicola]MBL7259438.1 hypothetical protein [Actinoplanes lichenicola]
MTSAALVTAVVLVAAIPTPLPVPQGWAGSIDPCGGDWDWTTGQLGAAHADPNWPADLGADQSGPGDGIDEDEPGGGTGEDEPGGGTGEDEPGDGTGEDEPGDGGDQFGPDGGGDEGQSSGGSVANPPDGGALDEPVWDEAEAEPGSNRVEGEAGQDMLDEVRSGAITKCSVAMVDGGWEQPVEPARPYLPALTAPVPTHLAPKCGTVVGTTKTVSLSAAFDTTYAPRPTEAFFEYEVDDQLVNARVPVEGPRAVLEFAPGELGPGESYRWRVRGTPDDAPAPTWSDWCTFTVAGDALDLRELDPSEVAALLELGIRPERRYPVTLTAAQWRLVREPFEFDPGVGGGEVPAFVGKVPRTAGRLTLTGAEWTKLILELAGWAGIVQFGNDEVEPEFRTGIAQYWTTADRISAQLGGPAHPGLGLR